MPVSGEKYVAPVWKDNAPPALDAAELQAMTDAIERTEASIGDVTTPAQKMGLTGELSIGKSLGVLADVGNVHVWKKVGYQVVGTTKKINIASQTTTVVFNNDSVTIYCGTGVKLTNGELALDGTTATTTTGDYQNGSHYDKKYFYIIQNGFSVFYQYVSQSGSSSRRVYTVYPITVIEEPIYDNSITFPTSTNQNAYQEGTVGDITIKYLGLLGDKVKIELASYIGTGGGKSSSDPVSLTASFPIKVASFFGYMEIAPDDESTILHSLSGNYIDRLDTKNLTTEFKSGHGFKSGTTATPYCKKSADGKTLYWYNSSGGSNAFNASGNIYYFLVFG